ncbi:uncharacterized protein LOC119519504 isoform X1 [Choloepus didactylus]|uniref:uncharacterized protein LOC119519504 isoform X1 n=1 Tax=Choloepus didactylus TaxID=27675 RepID=UPI00189EF8EB|nr:uncharacterized protein LOC119519504 isoform X1 [Choloepus didactylus]
MATPRGLLLVILAKLLAVHVNSSHHIQPGLQQELDMASWEQGEEDTSFLMASTQSWLPLWLEANRSSAAGLVEIPPISARQSSEESSAPTTQPLQVVLQVLHDTSPPPYTEGSSLTLQAHIQPASNEDMKLYVDECVGTQSQYLNRSNRMYTLVFNWGCLSIGSGSGSWSRLDNESLQFGVEAFLLNNDVELDKVYIICWTSIWSWMRPLEPGRKSCFYNTSSYSWQLADNDWASSVCDCCNFGCSQPKKGRYREFPEEGEIHMAVAGPLKVKKLPVSWFKASCKTLKDLLVAALALTCLALMLVFLLLMLRKVHQAFPLPFLTGHWISMPRGSQGSLEAREMGWVAAAASGRYHRVEDLETLTPSEDS